VQERDQSSAPERRQPVRQPNQRSWSAPQSSSHILAIVIIAFSASARLRLRPFI
jgi:hypothetical protein